MQIGYRFRPTEEELLSHYLKHKLVGNDSMVSNITEIHLNNIEPWELPAGIIIVLYYISSFLLNAKQIK
jgi:hypothetical protein